MSPDTFVMSYTSIRNSIVDFLGEEDGPTAVEYAVMIALIVAVCIGSVNFLAAKTDESFAKTSNAVSGEFGN